MTDVAILTPTIRGRGSWLAEAAASVLNQTMPAQHLIWCDTREDGPAVTRNRLLAACRGKPFVGFLDDDDLLDVDHVETLMHALRHTDADLAFSWHRTLGDRVAHTPRVDTFDDWAYGTMLGGRNIIPVTVIAKRDSIMDAGAFDPADRYEDHALWLRMLDRGARFIVVPRETWTYRFHGGNRTWQ